MISKYKSPDLQNLEYLGFIVILFEMGSHCFALDGLELPV